jgi:hypothetical protein
VACFAAGQLASAFGQQPQPAHVRREDDQQAICLTEVGAVQNDPIRSIQPLTVHNNQFLYFAIAVRTLSMRSAGSKGLLR